MWKDEVVTWLKVLFRYLDEQIKEIHENLRMESIYIEI
jgi:hypothetical protein